jgi:hypothetical protein
MTQLRSFLRLRSMTLFPVYLNSSLITVSNDYVLLAIIYKQSFVTVLPKSFKAKFVTVSSHTIRVLRNFYRKLHLPLGHARTPTFRHFTASRIPDPCVDGHQIAGPDHNAGK